MVSLSCATVLAIAIIAISNYDGFTVNAFVILRNELLDDANNNFQIVQNDNQNGLKLIRSKRSPQTQDVYSPEFGEGYYVFPESSSSEGRSRSNRRQQNLNYRPLLSYKALKTKKKRLFVPNLFG